MRMPVRTWNICRKLICIILRSYRVVIFSFLRSSFTFDVDSNGNSDFFFVVAKSTKENIEF